MKAFQMITFTIAVFILTLAFKGAAAAQPSVSPAATYLLRSPAPGAVRLQGYLGEKIDLCIRNRIVPQNAEELIEPFRHREETRWWQSEFWGKWFTSLALAYRYDRDPALLRKMTEAAQGLIATQTPEGYIGNYRPDSHLKQWDIWGRKYCLLGLLAQYEADGDTAALNAARRLADYLLSEVGPGKADIVLTGNYRGMASSSVLEPIVQLYQRTGEKRYLDFALYIVERWESEQGPQLIGKALAGVAVARRFPQPKEWWTWENGAKAYEMMSCYEGLCELYRSTGKAEFLEACRATWENIRETEINVVGGGSGQECWYGGRARKTVPGMHTMETCVTVTWIKFCAQLLRLTGEPRYAEAIEETLYNALLGANTADGSDFAKYSPLRGRRSPGDNQCDMNLHCCNANGPRGLLVAPLVAAMASDEGPVVNLYTAGRAEVTLSSGNRVEIVQETDYPLKDKVIISIKPEHPERFSLRLRVPAWSAETEISADGVEVSDITPGAYARLTKSWQAGDSVILKLDLRGRVIRDPGGGPQVAVARGPVVLARDSRLESEAADTELQRIVENKGFVELQADPVAPREFGMVFSVPVIGDPSGRDSGEKRLIRMCDFASAGNPWDSAVRYRVWLPVLLDLSRPAGE